MPKKNGFCVYMEHRRPGIVAAGHELKRGRRDLALLVAADWEALSNEEKLEYCEQARLSNELAARKGQFKTGKNPASPSGPLRKEEDLVFNEQDWQAMKKNRSKVYDMFQKPEQWIDQPIVICAFSVYFEPEYCDVYVPAEIGLTAMSLKTGVTDNYARIIDPGTIPKGHEEQVAEGVKKLGIPAPGTCLDFADYDQLMFSVESFLDMYQGNLKEDSGELYVFAFDSDYVVVTKCFEWLMEKTKYRVSVQVLSLDLYTFLGSTPKRTFPIPANVPSSNPGKSGDSRQTVVAAISCYRSEGKPLTKSFVYPAEYPMTAYGVFLAEFDVDSVIKQVDNYKYNEQLSCVYHIKSGQEIQNCALSTSNRYAYSILEVLTLSNSVPVIAGAHFPEVDKPLVEKTRRYGLLHSWGLTSFEVTMKEYSQASDLRAGKSQPGQQVTKAAKEVQPKTGRKMGGTKRTWSKPLSIIGKDASVIGGMQRETTQAHLGVIGQQEIPQQQQKSVENDDDDDDGPVYSYGALKDNGSGDPHPFTGDIPIFFRAGFLGSKSNSN